MWEALQNADWTMLHWVERHLHAAWLDLPMKILSDLKYFVPLLVGLGIWLLWKGGEHGRRLVVAASVLVLVTDQLSASVLRPLIERPRPYSESFGLPSSHATNIFGQAYLAAAYYPRLRIPLFVIAALVGMSRVYLGKHFPFDVLMGAGVGICCGALLTHLSKRYGPSIDYGWTKVIARLQRLRSGTTS